MFVVDGSASVGENGAESAAAFVDEAVSSRPGDASAGVVVFGGDARVDQVMADIDDYAGSSTVVDPAATDVAGGVRLGAALLPSDARRRVVLLSDGRANAGDLETELERLRASGLPVDVVTLESAAGPDTAVAAVDVPRLARVDERIAVVVHVVASEATTATVTLRRDGNDVETRTVQVQPGDNAVRFEDAAGADAGAVVRYQAVVASSGDTVADNDAGFAAVPVDGPARVLVIEGSPDGSDTLVSALEAGGVGTEVVGVGDIPDVQELITYAGIVMVDVDARTLSGKQIETLTTAVRDLGRGLVTIGGRQSYGVGGYRESPLSDLLPVDSEILDPQRRRTVAEVLSIDTSESMSACHCRDDQMINQVQEGGVNKTDISRAAAERTIAALADSDEVGVLAWNSSAEWVIPLQQLPPADVVERGLRSLRPFGQTDIRDSLHDAAEALVASDAELKHIILFTDGFTDLALIRATAAEAAAAVRGPRDHDVGAGDGRGGGAAAGGHRHRRQGSLLRRHRPRAGAADHGRGGRDRQPQLHHRGRVPPRGRQRRRRRRPADRVATAARLRRHDGEGSGEHAAAHRARPRPAAGHVAGRARPRVELDERRHRLVSGVVVVGRLRRLLVAAGEGHLAARRRCRCGPGQRPRRADRGDRRAGRGVRRRHVGRRPGQRPRRPVHRGPARAHRCRALRGSGRRAASGHLRRRGDGAR